MARLSYIFVSFAMLALIAFVISCATPITEITPKDDGSYVVTSVSYSKSRAQKAAWDAAYNYCQKQGKKMVSLDGHSETEMQQASNGREPTSTRDTFDRQTNTGNISREEQHKDTKFTLLFKCM